MDNFNLDELSQESKDAKDKQALLRVAGLVGQSISNVQSPYELLYNKKTQRPDIHGIMNAASDSVVDPLQEKSRLAKAYLENRGLIKAQEEDAQISASMDPNSTRSLALKKLAPRWGLEITPEMSAYDIEQMIDPKRMMQTEADRKANIESQKSMAEYADRLRRRNKEQDFSMDLERFKKEQEIKSAMGGEKAKFDRLPEDQKNLVEGLSKKNASKVAIASQIDSALKNAEKLPDDQKLMQYRQMIKVLNSTEGQDAVGVEEAKRLAGMLEFRIGNILEPGEFFGRDLPGFEEQAKITSNALKMSTKTNQGLIDKVMGRSEASSPIYDFVSPSKKTVVKRQRNQKTGQERVVYSDGSVEILK